MRVEIQPHARISKVVVLAGRTLGFLSEDELYDLGFADVGRNVSVSPRAVFHNPGAISLGDFCRIDDFCVLSAGTGGITIGRYVHIGCFSSLIGAGPIVMEDLSGLSSRVSVYSSTEDFSGLSIPLPTVPPGLRNPSHGPVRLCKHVAVGAGAVVLPNVTIETGAVIGALSLVQKDCKEFGVYTGVPARRVSYRFTDVLELEALLSDDKGAGESR